MARSKSTAPQAQPTSSQAIRAALAGMEEVSAMILTVGRSLNDDAAEQQATLTAIDQMLTKTHDELERAEWAIEPSERQAGETAPLEPPHPSLTIRALIDEMAAAIGAGDPGLGHIFDRLTDAIWQAPAELPQALKDHPCRTATECFYTNADDLPIAGTPAPLPCPFCGASDQISVVIERRSDNAGFAYVYVHVQCDGCGCEAGAASSTDEDVAQAIEAGVGSGPYCAVLEAAKRWNERKGS